MTEEITIPEAAERFGLCRMRLRRLYHRGFVVGRTGTVVHEHPRWKNGKRTYRTIYLRLADVEELVETGKLTRSMDVSVALLDGRTVIEGKAE